jgi:hypothetical protein
LDALAAEARRRWGFNAVTDSKRQRAPAQRPRDAALAAVDRPVPSGVNAPAFGSDVVADALRATGIDYIALNPGASYRGFHDSLVNYLGNERPQILLCLHEESAIAIAHGYAKVTGKAMAAMVHSNVGLMHGTMAIFNAWCDRMPILVFGATGPVDAVKRRPWIDWIHTARDQGALVRGYTKWDDQPVSPAAAREAVLRAAWIANTQPCGPTYVNLDAGMQEEKLAELPAPIDAQRFMPEVASAPAADVVEKAAALLRDAKQPLILAGRVSRDVDAWDARIALAERLSARVVTDIKTGAAFPTDHPLHSGAPSFIAPAPDALEAIRAADVILSLDWIDVAGTLKHADNTTAKIVQVSNDHHLHNGWSMDYQGLPPVDAFIACAPEAAVPALLAALGPGKPRAVPAAKSSPFKPEGDRLTVDHLAASLREAVGARPCSLAHVSLSWNGASWPFTHPLDSHGRHRAVDGGTLQDPAAYGDRQQPLLFQRRAAPGARGAHAQPPGGKPLGRPAHLRSRHRPCSHGARARCDRIRPGYDRRGPSPHVRKSDRGGRGRRRRGRRCARGAGLHCRHDRGHDPQKRLTMMKPADAILAIDEFTVPADRNRKRSRPRGFPVRSGS